MCGIAILKECVVLQYQKNMWYCKIKEKCGIAILKTSVVLQYYMELVRLTGLKIIPDILHKSGDILNN